MSGEAGAARAPAEVDADPPAQAHAGPRARGSMGLYGVAFAAMVGAGLLLGLAAREFLRESGLLWGSIALSAVAVGLAVASVVLPRRR